MSASGFRHIKIFHKRGKDKTSEEAGATSTCNLQRKPGFGVCVWGGNSQASFLISDWFGHI